MATLFTLMFGSSNRLTVALRFTHRTTVLYLYVRTIVKSGKNQNLTMVGDIGFEPITSTTSM